MKWIGLEWRKGGGIGEKSCPKLSFSRKHINSLKNKLTFFWETKNLREYPSASIRGARAGPGPRLNSRGQGAGPGPSTMLLESYRNCSFSFLDKSFSFLDGSSSFLDRSFSFLDGSCFFLNRSSFFLDRSSFFLERSSLSS